MFPCINLILTDHRNQLDTSTIKACLDIKFNSNCTDCRTYEPSHDVVKATRKVTPGSELAPAAESTSFPSFSSLSSSIHSYRTLSGELENDENDVDSAITMLYKFAVFVL